MSIAIIRVLHIIGISFLGGLAYSIRKKVNRRILSDTFINGMFGLALGMFVATYSDNQYFILSTAALASLYGDKVISSFFKDE